ncbi:MAG: DUF2147 domain-containing protein [Chitinispirillaceae bacterium]|nr:DUF2147 domain-containing protein [Chitinispirillaceae bacterium]
MTTLPLSILKNNKKVSLILKIFLFSSFILFSKTIVSATDFDCDEIIGRWYTDKREAIFEFFKNGEEYFARLIPLKNPDSRDSLNPVDSLKSRKLYNIIIINGIMCNKRKRIWEGGTIYNPQDGKTYKCICKIMNDKRKLMIRGFLGITLLGDTKIFTRD